MEIKFNLVFVSMFGRNFTSNLLTSLVLLISSNNRLLQENCTDEIICVAENNLKKFVLAIPQLLSGENCMKFN